MASNLKPWNVAIQREQLLRERGRVESESSSETIRNVFVAPARSELFHCG
jgi:hypothetical protein